MAKLRVSTTKTSSTEGETKAKTTDSSSNTASTKPSKVPGRAAKAKALVVDENKSISVGHSQKSVAITRTDTHRNQDPANLPS